MSANAGAIGTALATRTARRRFAHTLPLSIRLIVVYALLVGATLLVVAGTTSMVVRSHFERAIDGQLAAAERSFQRGPAAHARDPASLLRAARNWLAEQPLEKGDMAGVRVGHRVLTSAGDLDLFEVANGRQLLTTRESRWWNLSGREGQVRGLTVPLRAGNRQLGTLVLLAYKEKVSRAVGAVRAATGWASLIGIAFAALLGFLLVRRNLQPLARMTRQVEAVESTGDLSRRVGGGEADDEVGRLAAAFDRMLARLEGSFQSKQRLLADSSHELRTPLTIARGELELLAEKVDKKWQPSLGVATDELDRMARIVDDLLLLARLDEGLELAPESVEVELVLREAVLRAMHVERRDVRIRAEPGVCALADPERLLQSLTNLVTNAIEHSPDHVHLTLSSARKGDSVVICVSDTGPGIPPSDLPHVFERLYRGSPRVRGARTGAGLGLAITSSIVRAMNGTIEVESLEGAGTTFTIRLPADR